MFPNLYKEEIAINRYVIGADVGGTKIAYGLFDQERKLVQKYRYPSDKSLSPEAFGDTMIAQIKDILLQNNVKQEQLDGVGIGVPSFLLFDEGVIVKTSNLPNLKNFAARDYFQKALGVRVVLDNDANAAALAEHRYGAGKGFKHMIYCPISTGISNGIIINNQLFRGTYGWAGEAGHMIADIGSHNTHCSCGNPGCFESNISGGRIVLRVADKIRAGEKSIMTQLCGGKLELLDAKMLQDAYEQDDALAIWAVEHMSKYLGIWLYNLYLAFNINCYVFGGGMTKFGDALFGRVERVFLSYNKDERPVYIKIAQLGSDFGIIGAAELID